MNSSVEFVAEIGSAHKGIKSLAYEMIRQFSQAGATVCKFQLGHDNPLLDNHNWVEQEFEQQGMRHAPMKWVTDLSHWCKDFGVEFLASIWSQEGLDAARYVRMKRYKIAHQKWGDKKFLDMVLEDGKEVLISVPSGASIPSDMLDKKLLRVSGGYPSYSYWYSDLYYGYSSHMHGIEDALMAIRDGALLVEKHCTLDKTEESIRDNSFALYPDEFADMVKHGNEIHRLTL